METWKTFIMFEHLDEQTGEIIKSRKLKTNYKKIRKTTHYEKNGNENIKHITYWCEKEKQLKLL